MRTPTRDPGRRRRPQEPRHLEDRHHPPIPSPRAVATAIVLTSGAVLGVSPASAATKPCKATMSVSTPMRVQRDRRVRLRRRCRAAVMTDVALRDPGEDEVGDRDHGAARRPCTYRISGATPGRTVARHGDRGQRQPVARPSTYAEPLWGFSTRPSRVEVGAERQHVANLAGRDVDAGRRQRGRITRHGGDGVVTLDIHDAERRLALRAAPGRCVRGRVLDGDRRGRPVEVRAGVPPLLSTTRPDRVTRVVRRRVRGPLALGGRRPGRRDVLRTLRVPRVALVGDRLLVGLGGVVHTRLARDVVRGSAPLDVVSTAAIPRTGHRCPPAGLQRARQQAPRPPCPTRARLAPSRPVSRMSSLQRVRAARTSTLPDADIASSRGDVEFVDERPAPRGPSGVRLATRRESRQRSPTCSDQRRHLCAGSRQV